MPNTGRPSAGCQSCRRMKVKCDEARPECGRCTRAGRQCPGYDDVADNFRHMNKATEARALRIQSQSIRRRSTPSQSRSSSPRKAGSSESPNPDGLDDRRSLRLAQQQHQQQQQQQQQAAAGSRGSHTSLTAYAPPTDWDQQAISLFFSEFIFPENLDSPHSGWFDFLPEMCAEQAAGSYLLEATKAVALLYLGNRSCMHSLDIRARKAYGEALARVGKTLNDPVQQKSDETIVTLAVLGLFEAVNGGGVGPSEDWDPHIKGQSMLLRLRGDEQFRTPRGRSIFRTVNSRLVIASLIRGPVDSLTFAELPFKGGPREVYLNPAGRTLADVATLIGDFLQQTNTLLLEPEQDASWAAQLMTMLDEGLAIDSEIQKWCNMAPADWRAKPVVNAAISPGDAANPLAKIPVRINLFSGVFSALVWTFLHAAHIRLMKLLIQCTRALTSIGYEVQRADLSPDALGRKTRDSVEQICNSAPYLLCEVDQNGHLQVGLKGKSAGALFLLWPLYTAADVDGLDSTTFDWIMTQLDRIGTTAGIRYATTLKERHELQRRSLSREAAIEG